MKVYRSHNQAPEDFGPSALTVGNFDGVHIGHRGILRQVRALANARGWKASVLTFDPHPTRIVAPARTPKLLTTPERRVELMQSEGVEQVFTLAFTPELAQLSPEQFVKKFVVDQLGARAVLVGENFRFGHRQAGNAQTLGELGRKYGFETRIVAAVTCRGRIVSSSGIRDLIEKGRVSLAARFLTAPYALDGQVIAGRGVGSKQTAPTLNLATPAEVIPGRGVYVTRTRDLGGGREWSSVTNVGYRPTFGEDGRLSIETFLLDPLAGEAPRHIRVEFLWRIRDERKFESAEALKAQIFRDARAAERYFRRAKMWARLTPA